MMEAHHNGPSGPSIFDISGLAPGSREEKYAGLFRRSDPLADAVMNEFAGMREEQWRPVLDMALTQGMEAVPDAPHSLRALFAQLDDLPFWVDHAQCDLGGATFLRCRLGFVALAMLSLPLIYSWPAGNKPLALSGQLVHRASQRLRGHAPISQDQMAMAGSCRSSSYVVY